VRAALRTVVPVAVGLLLVGTTGLISDVRSVQGTAEAQPEVGEREDVRLAPNASTGSCGVERWSVKTGTDADVAKVNLGATTPTTIATQAALTAPGSLPSNNRVTPVETTVYSIDATLTEFKLEQDSDYHLVLSDGGGHTMIAEIADPACVGTGSPFLSGIRSARSEFDARFTATSSFQMVNQTVHLRGVGFWDFLHGQTGVAPNGIELHPLLDVTFGSTPTPTPTATATPTPTPTATPPGGQLITDGGFESATASGNTAPGWSATTSVSGHSVIQVRGAHPRGGSNYAELGGANNETDTLTQPVTVPATASTASLTFWTNVVSQETSTTRAFDLLQVEIHSSSGSLLSTPLTIDNRDRSKDGNVDGTYFQPAAVDLGSFRGQSIQLVFHATNDFELTTTFRVDDVSIVTG
jgi:hypothetical protein